MRKLSILFLSIVAIFAFSSCDKGEFGPVMSTTPGSPTMTAPDAGSSYTLTEDAANDTLMTLNWTEPDYGFSAGITYTIEMDQTGNNFADAMDLATTHQPRFSITTGDMNGKLLGAGYSPKQEITLEFRVSASVADSVQKEVSEPISLSFTPYSVCQYCPAIYVPGGYQGASGYTNDWSPADAPALHTVDGQDQYEGYVNMANANSEFKFTADQSWATNWGDNGGDGTLENGGANIKLAESGYYKFNVDINALTYSTLKTTWGVIGSATADGWNSDQDMTYDPDQKVWTITTDLSAGEIKFRANNGWDLNYGDDGGDGSLEAGGANIAVGSAGNYTIVLDLSGDVYTYSLTKN